MGFDWVPQKKYKRHYICLKCKKGFKRSSEEEMKDSISKDFSNLIKEYYASSSQKDIVKYIKNKHQEIKVICPNCQNGMLQVHYNFEVPAQRDNKSWKKIQKTLSPKTVLNYDIYIQWHLLELQDTVAKSPKYKLLKQNLVKLENASQATKEKSRD